MHLNMAGMNALGPLTGLAYTTFIAADEQSAADSPAYYNTNQISDDTWFDCLSVPNGLFADNKYRDNYSQGNLWDTHTAALTNLIQPPEADFWVSMAATNDCLAWVAQVASYADGNQDSDGDKLKDAWELHGVNYVNLQNMGADPLHKDLFVEADYMAGGGRDA